MRNFINKAAWQDALLKEEILEEVGPSAELPTGDFDQLMGFDSEGNPVALELAPEHWTGSGSGIPVSGTNLAAYFPEGDPQLPAMRFLGISQIGESLIVSSTAAQARSAIGAGTSNFDGTWGSLSGKPSTFPPVVGTSATDAKPGNYVPTWGEVTGKPTTFAPAAHQHAIADVTGLQSALDAKATAAALSALEGRVAALEAAEPTP